MKIDKIEIVKPKSLFNKIMQIIALGILVRTNKRELKKGAEDD